jgi:HPt (histidine-containing phosphotransfer) domain-containing protein
MHDNVLKTEVLVLFRKQAGAYMEQLEIAANITQWREAAHTLKGASRAIGAMRVFAAARKAEAITGENYCSQEKSAALANIKQHMAEVLDVIEREAIQTR